nr:hypothetical protein [Oscillibacter sp.]
MSIMNTVRLPGYEERNPKPKPKKKRGAVSNDVKLQNSLSRSRKIVWELAQCNAWEHFVTLTLDAEKMNRYSLEDICKKLGKWVNNYNSRRGASIKYLLIPEQHKDGAWHLHGLLMGLPMSHLRPFSLNERIPRRIKELLRSGRQIYDWPVYRQSFGYVTVEAIRDPMRCASYITKYITKDLLQSSVSLNAHVYYCSHGLKRAELLRFGPVVKELETPDFENEYVHIKTFSSFEEAMSYFENEEDKHGEEITDRLGGGDGAAYQQEQGLSAYPGGQTAPYFHRGPADHPGGCAEPLA